MTMTPLVDVLFLLLIFFLLTWGGAQALGSRVELSKAKSGKPLPSGAVAVAVTDDGLTIDGRAVEVESLKDVPVERDVAILGARQVDYQAVITVLDTLRSSGHTRVALATRTIQ